MRPQTDGMVEKFNSTLTAMIAKQAAVYGSEWDKYLCYLLFAYRVKCHECKKDEQALLLVIRQRCSNTHGGSTVTANMLM